MYIHTYQHSRRISFLSYADPLNGGFSNEVISAYTAYNDGVNNALPQPSQLDLNGVAPSKYIDNLPG